MCVQANRIRWFQAVIPLLFVISASACSVWDTPGISEVKSTIASSQKPATVTSTNSPLPTSTKTERPTVTSSPPPSIILGEEIILTYSGFSFRPVEGFEVGDIYAPDGTLFGATLLSPSEDFLIELRGGPRNIDLSESEQLGNYFVTVYGITISDTNTYSIEIQGISGKATLIVLGNPMERYIRAIVLFPNETYGFLGILAYKGIQEEFCPDDAEEIFMTVLENIVFFGDE